jgi:hypothetical protein
MPAAPIGVWIFGEYHPAVKQLVQSPTI